MKVYMDMNCNEMVTEDVAHARMADAVEGESIMYHLYYAVGWDELRKHLVDDGFITEIIKKLSKEGFDERFEEYDLIESE